MTLEEKAKFIKDFKEKNYLYISSSIIQGGARLVVNYETLELYENMDNNTLKFAEKEIVNLISHANYNDEEMKDYINFNLIFCGNFDDLPNDIGNPIDFVMNNKEKIVAVYRYGKNTKQREFFGEFDSKEIIYDYGYLYLNFSKLLEEFDKANIKYEVDTRIDRYTHYYCKDDTSTTFIISYSQKKEKKYQLKKDD